MKSDFFIDLWIIWKHAVWFHIFGDCPVIIMPLNSDFINLQVLIFTIFGKFSLICLSNTFSAHLSLLFFWVFDDTDIKSFLYNCTYVGDCSFCFVLFSVYFFLFFRLGNLHYSIFKFIDYSSVLFITPLSLFCKGAVIFLSSKIPFGSSFYLPFLY